MTRKHFHGGGHGPRFCPTCGGLGGWFAVTVHRGGIARVLGQRAIQPARVWHEIRAVDERWRPAFRATFAYHDEDGAYHEPDDIGRRLVLAGWRAEKAPLYADDDMARPSTRVYWPQERHPKRTVARCPDSWHERYSFLGLPKAPRGPRTTDEYRVERAPKGVAGQRRADAEKRRKAKARRHKERQAKR